MLYTAILLIVMQDFFKKIGLRGLMIFLPDFVNKE